MSNWPIVSEEEKEAVLAVLRSGKINYWTGKEGRLFEKEFADYIGTKHAVAVSNGTVALELCLRSLGISAGDEVIVTSRTFVASASAIISVGATPVFADVDLDSQNITVETINAVMTPKTKAIIAVHLAGWPCDMPKIMEYAKSKNLFVVEDCAQAMGASIDGIRVGAWGDASAFSFCQDKIMTTGGEGGMITTNSGFLWKKMWSYKDHGKCYAAVYEKNHPPGFKWLHTSFGSNYRMTEMQAAIGRVQLKKLDEWLELRRNNAAVLCEQLNKFSYLRLPVLPKGFVHAYYKFYAFLDEGIDNSVREEIIQSFNEDGVACFFGSCSEIYLEECFHNHPSKPQQRLKNAKQLGETAIMFLCDPSINYQILEKKLNQSVQKLSEKTGAYV